MRRAQALLPRSWQGDSREARWRRSRGRRLLAGLLGGCAVLAVVGAVRPADPPTHAVTVAAHDLHAGDRLAATDLRQVRWAAGDRVPGQLDPAAATGKVVTAAIRSGEPVTSARVRGARSWPGLSAGALVVGVPSTDRVLLRVLQPGDRVDLIDTGKARTLATSVPVVAIPGATAAAPEETLGGAGRSGPDVSGDAPAVLVAVTPAQAAAIGSANNARAGGLGGGIQLALRADA